MNIFKIQKIHPSSQLQHNNIQIPKIPAFNFSLSTCTVLNYQIEPMLEIIDGYFNDQFSDCNTVVKTLKIISVSLSDSKLVLKLEEVLSQNIKLAEKMYNMLCLWASVHSSFYAVVAKLSSKLRKQIIFIIFTSFFLKTRSRDDCMKIQLIRLFDQVSSQTVMQQLKRRYLQWGQPLKVSVRKCMNLKTQQSALLNLTKQWIQYMLAHSQNKVLQLIQNIEQNKQMLDYLILNIPSMSSNFIKHLQKIINENNVLYMGSNNAKINIIFKSAAKEWINQHNNLWKLVDTHFAGDKFKQKMQILKLQKDINKQLLFSQCLTIKYLYRYFNFERFDFERQDELLVGAGHESWTEVYRSIAQCNNYRQFNLILINVNSAPKNWMQTNPFKSSFKNKPISKFISKMTDFYEQKQKQYLSKNKKIVLAYSSFLLYINDTRMYVTVGFQQLKEYLQQGKQIANINIRQQYPPFAKQLVQPKQIRKDHNIIIQAKLVKLLKKHKDGLTIDFFIRQSKYSQQIVQLALKRLISKGLAEQNQTSGYNYIP